MNFTSIINLLSQFVNASKLGGWVRGGVGVAFVALIAKYPILSNYIDPATQTQIAAVLATIVVGVWSQWTKTDDAKLAAVEAMPNVAKVLVTPTDPNSAISAAAADPNRPKVTAQ